MIVTRSNEKLQRRVDDLERSNFDFMVDRCDDWMNHLYDINATLAHRLALLDFMHSIGSVEPGSAARVTTDFLLQQEEYQVNPFDPFTRWPGEPLRNYDDSSQDEGAWQRFEE